MTCDHGALEIKINDDGKVCAPARCPLNGFWDVKGENVIASLPVNIETGVMDKLGERTEANAEMFEFVDSQLNSLKNAFENFLWTNNGCGPRKHGFSHECPTSLLAAPETKKVLACEKEVECDAHGQCWLPHGTVCEIPCKAGFMSISAVACIEGVLVPAVDEPFKGEEGDGNPYESLSELLARTLKDPPEDPPVDAFAKDYLGDEDVDGRRFVQNEVLRAMGLFGTELLPEGKGRSQGGERPGATSTFLQRIITHKGVCVPAVCDIVDLITDEYKAMAPAAGGRRLDADLHDLPLETQEKLVKDYLQDRPLGWSRQDALLSGRHPLPVDISDDGNKDEELTAGVFRRADPAAAGLDQFNRGADRPSTRC